MYAKTLIFLVTAVFCFSTYSYIWTTYLLARGGCSTLRLQYQRVVLFGCGCAVCTSSSTWGLHLSALCQKGRNSENGRIRAEKNNKQKLNLRNFAGDAGGGTQGKTFSLEAKLMFINTGRPLLCTSRTAAVVRVGYASLYCLPRPNSVRLRAGLTSAQRLPIFLPGTFLAQSFFSPVNASLVFLSPLVYLV